MAWTHEMLIGQQRVMSTAYGTEQAEAVARLEGGVPQGDPASPGYWVIVLDFVLTYVATAGGAGYKLYGVAVQMSGYADDLAPMSATRESLQQTVAATMAAVGVITVRVNEVKSYYVRSPAGLCDEWALGGGPDGGDGHRPRAGHARQVAQADAAQRARGREHGGHDGGQGAHRSRGGNLKP